MKEPLRVEVAGEPLRCQRCGSDAFFLESAAIDRLGLGDRAQVEGWWGERATLYVCVACGFVHWFFAVESGRHERTAVGQIDEAVDGWAPTRWRSRPRSASWTRESRAGRRARRGPKCWTAWRAASESPPVSRRAPTAAGPGWRSAEGWACRRSIGEPPPVAPAVELRRPLVADRHGRPADGDAAELGLPHPGPSGDPERGRNCGASWLRGAYEPNAPASAWTAGSATSVTMSESMVGPRMHSLARRACIESIVPSCGIQPFGALSRCHSRRSAA